MGLIIDRLFFVNLTVPWLKENIRKRKNMQNMRRLLHHAPIFCLLTLLAGVGIIVRAQERMTIQATAMGTSTQMGKIYNVNITIEQYSTPEDRKALIDAFKRSGQDGLVSVLEDMKPKGRIRFASGGVGNDIKYIIELPSEKGTADCVSSLIAL